MKRHVRPVVVAALLAVVLTFRLHAQSSHRPAENVIVVMTDGLRWQELFRGADSALMTKEQGVKNVDELKRLFWRDSVVDRRKALFPFLWQTVAAKGQLLGNEDKGSEVSVTNGFNFSYPGYAETLTGFPDTRINSNANRLNLNMTVLEWLNKRPRYHGKVAAFGAWAAIGSVVNSERDAIVANAGNDPMLTKPVSDRMALLNQLKVETGIWGQEPWDAFVQSTAIEYIHQHKPKVIYVSFGETDNWAHEGRYDLYLKSAHRVDQFIQAIWDSVQAMPAYRGKTALLFTTDHGRGDSTQWKDHGDNWPESKHIMIAAMGAGIPARGEVSNDGPVTQSQIAATIAALLGEDYAGAVAKAGKPIEGIVGRSH